MLALALSSQAADFYSQEFVSAENVDGWLIVDANEDEKTWTFNEDATPSRFYYNYHSTNQADDWAISPAITFPEDGQYMVKVYVTGSSYKESMEIFTGASQSVDAMTDLRAEMPEIPGDPTMSYFFINGKEGETIHLGFHATSGPDKFRLYLLMVTIGKCDHPIDLQVTDVLSPVSAEGLASETVSVKVANTGLEDVDSFQVAYSVNDGEPVIEDINAPLAVGETMEHTFAVAADLSIPRENYTITAWTIHPDDFMPGNDAASTKVRHIAPATIPYYMGFEPDDDTDGITFFNLNEDSGDWEVTYNGGWLWMSRTGSGCLAYNYDKENAGDDWAILEPITMEAGHYALKFWYAATEDHPEKLRVCWGNAPTPEAMTNVIVEYNPMRNPTYEESINIVEIPEAGQIYFGFYAFSDADENWLTIDDLSIVKVSSDDSDIMVGEISHPWEYFREANKKDVNFSVRNVGIVDRDVTVKAYLDGNLLKEESTNIKAMEFREFSYEGLLEGVGEGSHTLRVEADCPNDTELDNNVAEHNFTVVANPYLFWDFEDAQIPENLTFRSEDGGTVNPDAGEEFNEDGAGIFNLQHYLLGNHALAVCSWIDNAWSTDRWVVLPQFHVNGENAHFVWDAVSYNPDYLEKYIVKVSKTEDAWYSYNYELTVNAESEYVKTRGISLAGYVGEDVYVAINVRTAEGEALILDNIGVYGDVKEPIGTGVQSVANGDSALIYDGKTLRLAGADAARIDLYNAAGMKVASANGAMLNASSLAKGIYVARATAGTQSFTLKFVVK